MSREQLTAEYDAWLAEQGLPKMSADELVCEIWAVRSGEKSEFVTSGSGPEFVERCMEQESWLSDFIARWEEVEQQESNRYEPGCAFERTRDLYSEG